MTFNIERKPCTTCGEPPFGDEYCCGHTQTGETVAITAQTDATEKPYCPKGWEAV